MHELFAEVLSKKDLSKAGELFSLEDEAIEKDLEEIVQHILKIADTEEYENNDNDQSVVEICITRVTTAIRFVLFFLKLVFETYAHLGDSNLCVSL